MSKFTAGKWKVHDWTEYLHGEYLPEYVVQSCDTCIADCFENEANARLIASAPKMYEVLKEFVALEYSLSCEGTPGEGRRTKKAFAATHKLLARIDGDSDVETEESDP